MFPSLPTIPCIRQIVLSICGSNKALLLFASHHSYSYTSPRRSDVLDTMALTWEVHHYSWCVYCFSQIHIDKNHTCFLALSNMLLAHLKVREKIPTQHQHSSFHILSPVHPTLREKLFFLYLHGEVKILSIRPTTKGNHKLYKEEEGRT